LSQNLVKPVRNQIESAMYEWSEWSECTTECIRTRTRACPDGFDCTDGILAKKDCSIERQSAGLVCWKEKSDLISKHLKNCQLKPATNVIVENQLLQSRIVQGNDYNKRRYKSVFKQH